jgi:RHS repeat-associated protein
VNGNMLSDLNKGISEIKYNYLNLPTEISWTGSSNKIRYTYNAAGQKVKKTVVDGSTNKIVDYLDGFQYAGEILQFFPHSEGYVKATPGMSTPSSPPTTYSYNYVYNYTDHLGNVRLSYSKNPITNQLNILEENHYYPFGLKHEVYVSGGKRDYRAIPDDNDPRLVGVTKTDYQYKYNGKEWQDELGLGMYDYGWRQYDPAIARWVVPDPLLNDLKTTIDFDQAIEESDDIVDMSIAFSEKMKVGGGVFNPDNLNPYSYGYNNPVSFDDPDGRCPVCLAVWAVIEIGLTVYDGVEVARTFLDPNASNLEKGAVLGGFGLGLAAPGGGYGVIGKFIAKQLTSKTTNVVNKVLKNTSVTSTTSKGGIKTTQRSDSGGVKEANKKFDKMKPKNVREIKDKKTDEVIGREGTLPDGSSVNVRTKSSDPNGEATLEVQRKDIDGKVIEKEKVRFTE